MSQYYCFNWISNSINAALEDKTVKNLTDFKCLNGGMSFIHKRHNYQLIFIRTVNLLHSFSVNYKENNVVQSWLKKYFIK